MVYNVFILYTRQQHNVMMLLKKKGKKFFRHAVQNGCQATQTQHHSKTDVMRSHVNVSKVIYNNHGLINQNQGPKPSVLYNISRINSDTYFDSSSSLDLANSRLLRSTCSWGVCARSSWRVMMYRGIWTDNNHKTKIQYNRNGLWLFSECHTTTIDIQRS